MDTLLGLKKKMTQAFVDNKRVPVTVVSLAPNTVTQILLQDKNGYSAVQLSVGQKKVKNTSKPLQGHYKKAKAINEKTGCAPQFMREVILPEDHEYKAGDKISLSEVFTAGDTITVTGVSKGKGFAGGVKRWGFAGGPKTHGQSDRHRAPGSIGQGTSPGRVWKGKKMAGRMGSDTITVKNLKVVAVDEANNELHIAGPVPGAPKTLLVIKRTSPMQEKVSEKNEEAVSADDTVNQNES